MSDTSPRNLNFAVLRQKTEIRGYVRGCRSAAAYLDIDRKTFRSWRDDPVIPESVRRLLQPRIIRGESYYRLENLDRFMSPANNPPIDTPYRPPTRRPPVP